MLHDIPEIIERPCTDGAQIEFVAPGFKPLAIGVDLIIALTELAKREVVQQSSAVH